VAVITMYKSLIFESACGNMNTEKMDLGILYTVEGNPHLDLLSK